MKCRQGFAKILFFSRFSQFNLTNVALIHETLRQKHFFILI